MSNFKENRVIFSEGTDEDYCHIPEHIRRAEIVTNMVADFCRQKQLKHPKLLSLGCSTGVIEERMINQGIQVTGLDIATEPLQIAKQRQLLPINANMEETLPFPNNTFNLIFSGESIEHIFDTRHFLHELNRVCQLNGHLILTTPNFARIDDRLKLLLGKTPRQLAPLHQYLYLHIRPFTYDLLKQSLQEFGFDNFQLMTNAIRIDIKEKTFSTTNQLLTELFPTLGATLIVGAEKLAEI